MKNEWATLNLEVSEILTLMWALEIATKMAMESENKLAMAPVSNALAVHNRLQSAWLELAHQ